MSSSVKLHGPMREETPAPFQAIPSDSPQDHFLTGLGGNTLNPLAIPPQRMQGFYIQGNYHFMPAFLTKLSPKRFGEGSTFTAVVRYDRVNMNWITRGGRRRSGTDFLRPELSPD